MTATVVLAAVVPVGIVAAVQARQLDEDYLPTSTVSVGRSPDGTWEVVRTRYDCACDTGGYIDRFHLRSRAGWRSRESPRPLAVIAHSFQIPDIVEIATVGFPGAGTIEVHTRDGAVHRTTFDPAGLVVADRFKPCRDWSRLCR